MKSHRHTATGHVYVGTFLIAFSTLAVEITLTRILSVITWYHLAFFAISTAMLGATAGATTVFLRPAWFGDDELERSLTLSCLGYAVVTPIALILLCLTPIDPTVSAMGLASLIVGTIECSLPFFFAGLVLAAVLTRYTRGIGRLYASDLLGAASGCLLVLGGLELFGAPNLILIASAFGALAALAFCWRQNHSTFRSVSAGLVAALLLVTLANASTTRGISPIVIKGRVMRPNDYYLEKWNSYSRVAVFNLGNSAPNYWGPSPLAPKEKTPQYFMNIDGAAGTTVGKFSALRDIAHLRYDLTNLAHYLRPSGAACVIGVGGGRDVQAAVLFGHDKVTGIDVNPIFVGLLRREFRDFAGISTRPEVTLVVDEARSFLSHSTATFSILQMSLIDTFAATGAGAFSLSENGLYTTEAWELFIRRLTDDGIFTVSRWYNPRNLGETGRAVGLAMASLFRSGTAMPRRHIAMVTVDTAYGALSTLLVSKQPFSEHDLATLTDVSHRLQYDIAILPGSPAANGLLEHILTADSEAGLKSGMSGQALNYEPTSDENPYFFNMLRLSHLTFAFQSEEGVVAGNLMATLVLLGLIFSLTIVAVVTIVAPLWVHNRMRALRGETPARVSGPMAVYFSLIGAGFMLVEIALIQRLSVFLGHPVYALGVLLFALIASTGIGSFISESLPLTRKPWMYVYVAGTVAVILVVESLLPVVMRERMADAVLVKIGVAITVIFPLGLLLGCFFPTGMRLVNARRDPSTAWYWAMNGVCGVLCSALAVFISIYYGISRNLQVAAVLYAATLGCLYRFSRDQGECTTTALEQSSGVGARPPRSYSSV
jgi:hypothetical protein